jgi:hypothetical protein
MIIDFNNTSDPDSPSGASFVGCFKDKEEDRTLTNHKELMAMCDKHTTKKCRDKAKEEGTQ